MAKPTHPTPQSLKTGQTIYALELDVGNKLKVGKKKVIRVARGNTPQVTNSLIFHKQTLEEVFREFPQYRFSLFYSRRKAERAVEKLNKSGDPVYQLVLINLASNLGLNRDKGSHSKYTRNHAMTLDELESLYADWPDKVNQDGQVPCYHTVVCDHTGTRKYAIGVKEAK